MLFKVTGIDQVIDHIINKLGNVEEVVLTGTLSKGIDTKVIDLVIAGAIDKVYATQLIDKAEKLIDRKIKYVFFDTAESNTFKELTRDGLIIWKS